MNVRPVSQQALTVANFVLLAFLLLSIFFVMLVPAHVQKLLYHFCIIGILLSAFVCIDKKLRWYMRVPMILTILLQWAYLLTDNFILNGAFKSLTICLYIAIAFFLIKQ